MLAETVILAQELIRDICRDLPCESDDAKYIFSHGLKDFSHKDFEGWDEYSYTLLRSIAMLSDAKSAPRLYQALDEFGEQLENYDRVHGYTWRLGRPNVLDMLVRYEVMGAVNGDDVSDKYVYQNIEHDEFRGLAVRNAILRSDFAEGERLCLDALASTKYQNDRYYSYPSEWDRFLYKIYEQSGDADKQVETAEKILLLGDLSYFDILKNLLVKRGTWEKEYPAIRTAMEHELAPSSYMTILNKECDWENLMKQVRSRPEYVFDYGKALAMHYPWCHGDVRLCEKGTLPTLYYVSAGCNGLFSSKF